MTSKLFYPNSKKTPSLRKKKQSACTLQFNREGSLFMEYVDDYGYFEDVPLDFMKRNIKEHYPHIFDRDQGITEFKL